MPAFPLVAPTRLFRVYAQKSPISNYSIKLTLADPDITQAVARLFRAAKPTPKLWRLDLKNLRPQQQQIIDLINRTLAPSGEGRNTLAMVTGIPNVGKSSLINCLAGRHSAPRPATNPPFTKGQQQHQSAQWHYAIGHARYSLAQN